MKSVGVFKLGLVTIELSTDGGLIELTVRMLTNKIFNKVVKPDEARGLAALLVKAAEDGL
jgi:hypothetical protein